MRPLVWEESWVLDEATGCKMWIRGGNKLGYGHIRYGGKVMAAPRVAWMREVGPIPEGLHVRHQCDNPACVNVEHLVLGTHADNMGDMRARARRRGPKYRGENSGINRLRACEVEEIRRLCALGLSQELVGRMFRTCQQNVSSIVTGVTWVTE
jgi:hypothetical protein